MWQLVFGGWSNNVVCSVYLSLLEFMIRSRMCDISHIHLHCNSFIEHCVMALDIMILHWTSGFRILLYIPILNAIYVFLFFLSMNIALIMIRSYVLMCNVSSALCAGLRHIFGMEHTCIA